MRAHISLRLMQFLRSVENPEPFFRMIEEIKANQGHQWAIPSPRFPNQMEVAVEGYWLGFEIEKNGETIIRVLYVEQM
jgi:hypothetical protein